MYCYGSPSKQCICIQCYLERNFNIVPNYSVLSSSHNLTALPSPLQNNIWDLPIPLVLFHIYAKSWLVSTVPQRAFETSISWLQDILPNITKNHLCTMECFNSIIILCLFSHLLGKEKALCTLTSMFIEVSFIIPFMFLNVSDHSRHNHLHKGPSSVTHFNVTMFFFFHFFISWFDSPRNANMHVT